MSKFILGKKLGMTQVFQDNGDVVPVTLVETGPMTVIREKSDASDGYQALQLGFGTGWCGAPEYYCDQFPDAWGYPYDSFSTADWFMLAW